MSSQKNPTSPSLLFAVDSEQSFFRVLAFRASDRHHSINASEASTPISPMTLQTVRKRPPLRARSEESPFSLSSPEDESTAASAIRLPEVLLKEAPLLRVTKPSAAGLSSADHSGQSSINSRARNLLRGSWSRNTSASSVDAELPHDAKSDRSRRESSRHWFEIGKRRKMKSDGQMRTDSEEAPFAVPFAKTIQNTPRASETIPKGEPIRLEKLQHHDKPPLLAPTQKRGLYYRTKRRLGLGQEPNDSAYQDHHTQTSTGVLLERATTMLREISVKMMTPPSSHASRSNKSSQSNLSWHTLPARLIPFYSRIGYSSSSSIHNAKMGHGPQPSPNHQAMYTGSDSKQYFSVEISNPDGPSYLPSEARRINTPPSPKSTLNKQLRGFFFDYNAPNESTSTPSPDAVERHPLPSRGQRKRSSSGTDWFRVKLAADEANDAQRPFDLNVPDHLPNSPLCPRNPKHRSGGNGICVYHGRKKSIPREE